MALYSHCAQEARSPNPVSTPFKFLLFSEIQSPWPPSPALVSPVLNSSTFRKPGIINQFPALVSTIAATGKRYGWLQHFLRSIMMLSRDTWFPPPREFKASKFRVRIYLQYFLKTRVRVQKRHNKGSDYDVALDHQLLESCQQIPNPQSR